MARPEKRIGERAPTFITILGPAHEPPIHSRRPLGVPRAERALRLPPGCLRLGDVGRPPEPDIAFRPPFLRGMLLLLERFPAISVTCCLSINHTSA